MGHQSPAPAKVCGELPRTPATPRPASIPAAPIEERAREGSHPVPFGRISLRDGSTHLDAEARTFLLVPNSAAGRRSLGPSPPAGPARPTPYARRVQSAVTPRTAIPKPTTSDAWRPCPLPPKERTRRSQCVPSTASSRQPRSTSNAPRYRSISGNANFNRAGYCHQPGLVCPPLRSSSARALVRDLVDCVEMGRKTY